MDKKQPLIVEPHTEDYNDYKFLTVIRYNDINYLNIVDNVCKKYVHTYVLDFCKTENVDEMLIIEVALHWFEHNSDKYPISIEFSKHGLSEVSNRIIRQFSLDYITRIMGPLYSFNMKGPAKVRKRKRHPIS